MPLAPVVRHRRAPARSSLSRRRGGSLVLGLVSAFVLAACGGDDVTGPTPAGQVGPGGATVRAQGGQVTLDFPPGAVASEVEVTVERAQRPPADEGLLPGSAFDFGPDGLAFDQPVELTVAFDPSELPSGGLESGLAIHRAVGDGWQRVEGSVVDEASNRVRAPIHSFSVYAVVFLGAPQEVFRAGDAQTAVVGQAVETPPSVQVRTGDGEVFPGLAVVFSVVEGGGTVTGASQVTDREGRATVGSWVLGTAVGANRLRASVEGLETPVVFEAEAVAGPFASIAAERGDGQAAPAGTSVEVPPAVRVTDEFGNPVPGVEVSFSADAGGTVAPSSAATGADGVAAVDVWTLGEIGPNGLAASVEGLDPVAFGAQALDPCGQVSDLAPGATVAGELTGVDCQLESGRLVDKFGLTFAGQTAFSASLTASDFDPALFTFGADRQVHGASSGGGASVTIDYVLPAGSYELRASTGAVEPVTGSYTLATGAVGGDPTTGCLRLATVVADGVGVSGAISDGDCVVDFLGGPSVLRRFDHYALLVFAGETATATLSAGHRWALTLLDDGVFVTGHRNQTAGTSRSISYSPAETSFLVFTHWNEADGVTGSYDISFSVSGGGSSAARRGLAPGLPLLAPVEAGLPGAGEAGGR